MTTYLRTALAILLIAAAPQALAQTEQPAESEPAASEQAPAETAPPETEPAAETPAAEAPAAQAPAASDPGAVQAPAPQAGGQAQEVVTATHGDWTIVCAPAGKPCVMLQKGANAQGQNVMEVRIRRVEAQQTQQGTVEAAIQVAVPLGVLLPAGVNIQIDSAKPVRAGYTVCDRGGCVLQQPVPNSMIAAMKKGATAKFTIVAPPNREIEVPISLSGFTAAYESLQP